MTTNRQDIANSFILKEIKGYMVEAPGLRFSQLLENLDITDNLHLPNEELLQRVIEAREREKNEN